MKARTLTTGKATSMVYEPSTKYDRAWGDHRMGKLHEALDACTNTTLLCDIERVLQANANPPAQIRKASDALAMLTNVFAGQRQEHVVVMVLDSSLRVLHTEVNSIGGDSHAVFDAVCILRAAILHGGRNILVSHNHPSGDPNPSLDDIRATNMLMKACSALNVFLVDHIIWASSCAWYSMRDKGNIT